MRPPKWFTITDVLFRAFLYAVVTVIVWVLKPVLPGMLQDLSGQLGAAIILVEVASFFATMRFRSEGYRRRWSTQASFGDKALFDSGPWSILLVVIALLLIFVF